MRNIVAPLCPFFSERCNPLSAPTQAAPMARGVHDLPRRERP
ncbi:hypothetical protein Ga0080559_TMP1137 [Salipiger profundus]|uniref:Uncharacterized protein n=1 Tax=Salipiger profundus TaxID=1229727 RepID=A0A1U7D1E9_9RHOB|nr:hypothetical protein Ga0080559_TMP1137 [Salipiger profundus]